MKKENDFSKFSHAFQGKALMPYPEGEKNTRREVNCVDFFFLKYLSLWFFKRV
jgi:hypothetical protein